MSRIISVKSHFNAWIELSLVQHQNRSVKKLKIPNLKLANKVVVTNRKAPKHNLSQSNYHKKLLIVLRTVRRGKDQRQFCSIISNHTKLIMNKNLN